jgi:hypothetical protein
MSDREMLHKENGKGDEILLYKMGRRSRPQMENFIVRMMKKAREEERTKVLNERYEKD